MSFTVFLSPARARQFRSLQNFLVPLSQEFSAKEILESEHLVNELLAGKSKTLQLKMALFMWLIDCVSFLLGGSFFSGLSLVKKNLVMHFFFDSPVGLLRKGFWGINTLAKLGVYGQIWSYARINYHLREQQ